VDELGLHPQDVLCVSKSPLPRLVSQGCRAASLHVLTLPPLSAEIGSSPGPSAGHISAQAAPSVRGSQSPAEIRDTLENGGVVDGGSGEGGGQGCVREAWTHLALEAHTETSGSRAEASTWAAEAPLATAGSSSRGADAGSSGLTGGSLSQGGPVTSFPPASAGREAAPGSREEGEAAGSCPSRLAFLPRLVAQSQGCGKGGRDRGALVVGVVMKASRYAKLARSGLLPLVARDGVCFQRVRPGRALRMQGAFHALLVKVSAGLPYTSFHILTCTDIKRKSEFLACPG
jgi:hypothetical protein